MNEAAGVQIFSGLEASFGELGIPEVSGSEFGVKCQEFGCCHVRPA
jgi:hypothetical protein